MLTPHPDTRGLLASPRPVGRHTLCPGLALLLLAFFAAGSPVVAQSVIRSGQTVAEALSTTDPVLKDGSHYDCYALQTQLGETIQIDQTSEAFDSFLAIGKGSCANLRASARDDNGGGNRNARVRYTGDGETLLIQVNSLMPGQAGAYQLRVSASVSPQTADPSPAGAIPMSLPVVPRRRWNTDAQTCYGIYGAMVLMRDQGDSPDAWGNVGQIDYSDRRTLLRTRMEAEAHDPVSAEAGGGYHAGIVRSSMAAGIPWPVAEYLTALTECDRVNRLVPVTRF